MEFLAKPESEVIEVPRRVEVDIPEDLDEATDCKICGELSEKRRGW